MVAWRRRTTIDDLRPRNRSQSSLAAATVWLLSLPIVIVVIILASSYSSSEDFYHWNKPIMEATAGSSLSLSSHEESTTKPNVSDKDIVNRNEKEEAISVLPRRRSIPCGPDSLQTIIIDQEHVFWWEGQPKLCRLLREKLGVDSLTEKSNVNLKVRLTLNCTYLGREDGLGTGNWLVGLYMTRLATSFAKVSLDFSCTEGDYRHDVLAWLQGCYPPLSSLPGGIVVSEEQVCDWDMRKAPLYAAAGEIRDDMRSMVQQALLSSNQLPPTPSSSLWSEPPLQLNRDVNTLFGNVFLDDVAIHFRCGDVMQLARPRGDYGLTRFVEYAKRISPAARSIGIVTQPFEPSRNRLQDANFTASCRTIVESLQQYLKRHFLHVRVSIRNGPKETLVLAYLRLAVANQTLISLSSFSAFPLLAQFGEGYFEKGRMLVNQWLHQVPFNHIQPIEGDLLRNHRIMRENMTFILQWLNLY